MPADPSGLTGKVLWLRGSDLGAGGSTVTTWADQSGTGHNASYAGGAALTVAAASTPNGGKSAVFAGTVVNLPDLGVSGDGEMWIVVKATSTNKAAWKFGTAASDNHYTYSSVVYDDFGTTTRQSFTPTMSVTTWRLYRVRITAAGSWQAWLDGTSQGIVTGRTPGWTTAPKLAKDWTGEIAEVLVLDGNVTSGEAADLITYFNTAHGLTVPGGSAGTVTVAAPLMSVVAAAPAPVISVAATNVTVAAPVVALTVALLAPTVSTVTPQTITPPAFGLAMSAPAPAVSETTGVTVAAPILDVSVAVPAPVVLVEVGGSVTIAAPILGVSVAIPAPTVVQDTDGMATSLTHTPVSILVSLPLVPSAELAESAPIVRVSHQMPALTQADPAYTARLDYPVVKGVVGTVHLWIAGRDVTYFRDAVTTIRRWESEAPFGDTAAAFEFPQLNPWDEPGEGDLDFLYPDAPVAIGIVSPLGVVRRVWSGFLDARGNGTAGEREDYQWEAKGTLWQAQHQVREPYAILEPTDIGVLIARTLNDVIGRRWARLPETAIGIKTLTRGSRDESPWDYVQTLLSEAVTDAGRQWTLVEVSPGVFRLALKPASSTVHATVAYGTPGVDIDLRIDESTRVDGFYARGIGPQAGGWANVFYPALELLNPPPYPNSDPTDYLNLGTTDGDTTSGTGVTDWQTRVKEIGAWATPAVSGVMSSAWVAVVDDIQRTLGITADGSVGPQTWNATFDRGAEGIDLRPLRLPIAVKPWVLPNTYSATGVNLGPNPAHDDTRVPRLVPLDLGPGKTKAQGRALCRTLLAVYGEAAAYGTATWQFDPNETDRTTLSHLSNVKVIGHEGVDRVLQVSSKSVELETGDDGPLYVVTTRLDERARDAMAVEDLLEQRRSAQVDPSKRPGNQAKASRTVNDQRTPWDSESPCGRLRRTAVNGSTGLWSVVTVPFAEVGKLAGIRLTSGQPFALAIFASLRITENRLAAIVGDPFATSDPWRANKDALDQYGIIEAWGEEGNACGYSPQTESDGGAFTGLFELDSPVDYWTETPPYVSVAIWMRGGSGFIEGSFLPAYEG